MSFVVQSHLMYVTTITVANCKNTLKHNKRCRLSLYLCHKLVLFTLPLSLVQVKVNGRANYHLEKNVLDDLTGFYKYLNDNNTLVTHWEMIIFTHRFIFDFCKEFRVTFDTSVFQSVPFITVLSKTYMHYNKMQYKDVYRLYSLIVYIQQVLTMKNVFQVMWSVIRDTLTKCWSHRRCPTQIDKQGFSIWQLACSGNLYFPKHYIYWCHLLYHMPKVLEYMKFQSSCNWDTWFPIWI